jgi:superfamily II DNA/RNA helicase
MFGISELKEVTERPEFRADFDWVRQSLVLNRVNHTFLYQKEITARLQYFVECVLASAPSWSGDDSIRLCRTAAEIAELISECPEFIDESRRRMRIRSAILYELAGLPARSSSALKKGDWSAMLEDMFAREGVFRLLQTNGDLKRLQSTFDVTDSTITNNALTADAFALAQYEQGEEERPQKLAATSLEEVAKFVSLGLSASEIGAFAEVINKRLQLATRTNIDTDLFLQARQIKFPAELWTSQVDAIARGLLNPKYDSWGFAAPTGTGKTFLAKLLILKSLQDKPDSKVIYIVPTRALVHEVSTSFSAAFEKTDYGVTAVSPQLIALEDEEHKKLEDSAVAVMTPEKADLLLRLGVEFINNVSLVIVDEAHHIEAGTRGVLLELYLWRLKQILKDRARVVFLSAVAPNILQLAEWMGNHPGGITYTQRSTRMRVGVYRIKGAGKNRQGWIDYSDGTSIALVEDKVEIQQKRGVIQLANALSGSGPVLIVAKGKKECETLAILMQGWLKEHGKLKTLTKEEENLDVVQRLDSRLEREMYSTVAMRKLLRNRIAYHHAGLPPRVRISVEEAIRSKTIDYVFATTTLAEGVNFPFSTVIVQSLALREPPEKGRPTRYHPVTPRSFWNIAGRAGRPGIDKEGQAILFEPSLGLSRVNAVIENYLNPSLSSIEPVHSALAQSIEKIAENLADETIKLEWLNSVNIPEVIPKEVHGTINLLRVGLVHAKASKLENSPEKIFEGTFAARHMNVANISLALKIFSSQNQIVEEFINRTDALPIEVVAEIGLSLETLSSLRDYVSSLEEWQVQNMSRAMHGGKVNLSEARYIIAPVSARMTELEGPSLGGLYTEVILQWLAGVPFTTVKNKVGSNNRWKRIEDLISVIYSRIQYLLPWGLYAFHRLIAEETKKRGIAYNHEVRSLAYLADAGVPNFDALRLVGLDFERVDATRLARLYQSLGGLSLNLSVIDWVINQPKELIENCVRGIDNRRLDYDLFNLIGDIKANKPSRLFP